MTIKVDEKTHFIDHTLFDDKEAELFICLLLVERNRHTIEKIKARQWLRYTDVKDKLIMQFYESCAVRHQEDVDFINKTINYLVIKHGLKHMIGYEV